MKAAHCITHSDCNMKVLVEYVQCYLGRTVSIELPPCFPTECVKLPKHVHVIHVLYIPVLKFSHACVSELLSGQVLSQSVANALRLKKDKKYSALIQYLEMMNNTFDILNTRYGSKGAKTRNKWKLPLTTTDEVLGRRKNIP